MALTAAESTTTVSPGTRSDPRPRPLKRALASLAFSALPLCAQVPRAVPVEEAPAPPPPPARADPGEEFFTRGKEVHDSARSATDLGTRIELYQRAADVLARFLSTFPNHPKAEQAWWYLGNSYYHSGQIEDAKRCFHTLLNRHGEGIWTAAAAYTLAADHANKGEFAFAAPMFERYAANAAKADERARGHYLAAECYRRLGRDREATSNYRKAAEDPDGSLYFPQSKIALGHLALKSGKAEEALGHFEEIIAGNHTAAARGEAALHGATAATKLGRTELADKYLGMILSGERMEEFRPAAQTALMENRFEEGKFREVIELYRRSSLPGEGEGEARRLMLAARSHFRLGEWEAARVLFREIEALVPPEHELAFDASYHRLLCTYRTEGQHMIDQVDAFLQIYRSTRPSDPRIHTAMLMKAEALFESGDTAAAAHLYSEIDAGAVSEKNRPGLLFKRGWCLAEAGDIHGAIRSLGDFLAKYPDDERRFRALAKRGEAYAASGDSAKAIIDFDRLLAPEAPADLAAFAWLESARMRRGENNIADMVTRYKGLLRQVNGLDENFRAEANYWIGWGLVKTDAAPEAVTFLEAARELRPAVYGKHAGLLLTLGYYAAQDAERLGDEIERAIDGGYDGDIPSQTIQWAGMQAYNAGDYKTASRLLERISNPAEPRETPKAVWRFLAKARLETGQPEGALTAAGHVLAVEENPGWIADGLHDKARALFQLGRLEEAREAVDEGLALRPPPRTAGNLMILLGDMKLQGDDLTGATADYLRATELADDQPVRPLALWKLEQSLVRHGDAAGAGKYRRERETAFPEWTPPSE